MRHPAYDRLLQASDMETVPFHDCEPNPKYDSVLKGLKLFEDNHCDMLISVGGGSPMDVAKSIKAFVGMDQQTPCVNQAIVPNAIPHLAILRQPVQGAKRRTLQSFTTKGKNTPSRT